MYCPLHPDGDGPCGCLLQLEGDARSGSDMVHSDRVSFYPRSSMIRLDSRLYVFPYPTCRSLLITSAMCSRFGLSVFHRCVSRSKRNLYTVFQFVDANGFRYGIGYTLEVLHAGRTVLTHLRCLQRAVRAFLSRRHEARSLAVAMAIPLPSDLLLRLCGQRGIPHVRQSYPHEAVTPDGHTLHSTAPLAA
jgi:hypothetical protein